MKAILRTFIFVLISIEVSQRIVGTMDFGDDGLWNYTLVSVGLALLYFFVRPLLKVVSFRTKGLGYIFITFCLTVLILYVLTIFLSGFVMSPVKMSGLNVFGYILPPKDLDSFWAGVFASLVISLVYNFLQGVCKK